jgi:hypothetical protein
MARSSRFKELYADQTTNTEVENNYIDNILQQEDESVEQESGDTEQKADETDEPKTDTIDLVPIIEKTQSVEETKQDIDDSKKPESADSVEDNAADSEPEEVEEKYSIRSYMMAPRTIKIVNWRARQSYQSKKKFINDVLDDYFETVKDVTLENVTYEQCDEIDRFAIQIRGEGRKSAMQFEMSETNIEKLAKYSGIFGTNNSTYLNYILDKVVCEK